MTRGTGEASFPDDLCSASLKIHFPMSSGKPSPSSLSSSSRCPPKLLQSHQPEFMLLFVHPGCFLRAPTDFFSIRPQLLCYAIGRCWFSQEVKSFQGLRSLPTFSKCSKLTKGLKSCWGVATRQLCGQTDRQHECLSASRCQAKNPSNDSQIL